VLAHWGKGKVRFVVSLSQHQQTKIWNSGEDQRRGRYKTFHLEKCSSIEQAAAAFSFLKKKMENICLRFNIDHAIRVAAARNFNVKNALRQASPKMTIKFL
jgi:hypothetical protein